MKKLASHDGGNEMGYTFEPSEEGCFLEGARFQWNARQEPQGKEILRNGNTHHRGLSVQGHRKGCYLRIEGQRSFPSRKRTGKKMVSRTLEPLETEVERCETKAGASSFSLHGEVLT